MALSIYDLRTEYLTNPIGIDTARPVISWKLASGKMNTRQAACRLTLGTEPGTADVWDSGELTADVSTGLSCPEGILAPCTRYYVTLRVTDNHGERAEAESFFETGLMDPTMKAWEGAEWIGPAEPLLDAGTRGVFGISVKFRFREGSTCCGLVFGDQDKRITDRDNYFRFDVNAVTIPATLDIYRVGIAADDRADRPWVSFPLVDVDDPDKKPVITEDNRYSVHALDVQVTGDCAWTYLDGHRVDVTYQTMPWGAVEEGPRQLNPIGPNDVNTYPRLNRIGFFMKRGQSADFWDLKVRNLRKPWTVVYEEKDLFCFRRSEESVRYPLCGDFDKVRLLSYTGEEDCKVTFDPSHTSIPMLRREFDIADKPLKAARLYITARGIYDCRVNGNEITDTFFDPGQTQYDKTLMYQTYDLTDRLHPGKNAIGVILSSGWWCDGQTFTQGNFNYWGDRESLLAKLVLTYADGTREVVVTDPDTWRWSGEGPWTYAGFFHGEHYDATREEKFAGFAEAGYDDRDWRAPIVVGITPFHEEDVQGSGFTMWPTANLTEPEIVGQTGGGVYAGNELTAKAVTEIRPGVFIYDLGVNVAGVPKVKMKGSRGTTAQLRFAEILCPDFPEFAGRVGTLMVENLRDADCTDLYTFKGDPEGEVYMPRFTFRGCRYIEISGVTEAPAPEDVRFVTLSSVREFTGDVRVDNDMINFFMDNVRRSMRSNFISIPTDCPQRNERMGWNGDTSIFTRTATFNADTREFYRRWLKACRDLQEPNGCFPNIAPVGGGFGGYTYNSAPLHVCWELYQQYAALDIVKEHYPAMKAFMDYTEKKNAETGDIAAPMTLGDWLAPEETDVQLICHAFFGCNAYIMSKMAAAIGETEDARHYEKLYADLKKSFNEKWFDADGRTKVDTQCSYALPLAFHMVEDGLISKVGQHLSDKTQRSGWLVGTGFFGTAPLCPMLTQTGHSDDAYRLITQTACPSWLYPVTQGATSVWERWDSFTTEKGFGGHNNMNSFNHYSLGAVLEWFYGDVLGIRRDESAPGYRHFTLQPNLHGFGSAQGHFETPYGEIKVSLTRTDKDSAIEATVPVGTTATLILPGQAPATLGSGSYRFTF